jgi:hypothetical protein
MALRTVPQSFPLQPGEIKVITRDGKPVEVLLTMEQFERVLDLIEELEDRADFVSLKDAPARDFESFLKEL